MMQRIFCSWLLVLSLVLVSCGDPKLPPVPEPTSTASPSPDPSEEPTPIPSESPSPDPVPSEEPSPTPDPEPSVEPTPSPSSSPSPSPSPSPSSSPSPSPSPSEPPLDVDLLFSASASTRAIVREHVRKFILDGESVGVDVVSLLQESPKLEIRIASLDAWGAGVIGLCQTSQNYRILTLDPDYYHANQAEAQKRILFHHEMGHCVLFRGHRTATGEIPDGSGHVHELSIMYPTIMGRAQYELHEDYYLNELFEQLSYDDKPKTHVCK